jgi:plasmid stabilization system protein ParE
MSKKFLVRWTPEAESDVTAIVDWFEDSTNALKVIDQLQAKAESLATFPEAGRVVPELRKIGITQYHEAFHKPWRMMYAIRGDVVWIMAVVDSRRLLQDLLFERLTKP